MNKLATFFRESSTARFLIPGGLIFLVFGILFLIININSQNYIKVESVITKVVQDSEEYLDADGNVVDASYTLTVRYVVDGKEYESELPGSRKENVGDKEIIYYNPKNPKQITTTKSLVLPIIIIVGGAVAFCGGIVSGVNAMKRHQKMKEQEKGWENDK